MTDVIFAPTIWCTKLRLLMPGVDHVEQVAHNFDDGIVGIGWGLEDLPSRTPLDEVLGALEAKDESQSVDLEQLASAAPDAETALFAYSAAESYTGSPDREVQRIATAQLLTLVEKHPEVLPPRIRRWFELAKGS